MRKKGSSVERRVHPRRPYRTEVVFEDEFGDGLFYVYSQDVSLGGIFLASDVPLRVGTMLFVSFHLPHHKRPIRVTAEVVRHSESQGVPGMGVRFAGLPEPARVHLIKFLGT